MMTVGDLILGGSIVGITLLAAMIALLAAAFVIGRLDWGKRRGDEQHAIDALQRVRREEEQRLGILRKEKEDILNAGRRAKDAMERWETVKRDYERLEAMRRELDDFEREESRRIDEIERLRMEAARRLGEVRATLDQYPPEIMGDESTWKGVVAARWEEYDQVQKEVENAAKEYAEIDVRRIQVANEMAHLERKKSKLDGEIEAAQGLLDRLIQGQIDELKPYNERLLSEADQLRREVEDLTDKLGKRKADLDAAKQAIAKASIELASKRAAVDAVEDATIQLPAEALSVAIKEMPDNTLDKKDIEKLSAFRKMPDCLRGYEKVLADIDEVDLLSRFEEALADIGLQYPKRIIRAFHTALKVNDLSPLTVLSGLSGTGKSQLPRAYARFFGIHFLHVPVEPGWDSPQDLLGFYDFVAERYRPTDRARALGHFDRGFAADIGIDGDRNWDERMLIILLDEMNLARTEYYFSEFLSRLEMRGRRKNGDQTDDGHGDAQVAIDLPYAEGETPRHLYIPHNVLWVGTLNEDETTQALSDKVLDRANSIRFAPPGPGILREHSEAPKGGIDPADGYLPYSRWLEWSNRDTTVGAGAKQVEDTLGTLAEVMQRAGRGFGYRIAQSIRAYIGRYPGRDWRVPMVDQINMRLLPKLAGVEMNDCHDALNKLRELCDQELGDPAFADALQRASTDSDATQIFTWPGHTYEAERND